MTHRTASTCCLCRCVPIPQPATRILCLAVLLVGWMVGRPCTAQTAGAEPTAFLSASPSVSASASPAFVGRASSSALRRGDGRRDGPGRAVAVDRADDEPSRARQWRDRRQSKRQTMHPPRPGWLDRTGRFIRRTRGAVLGDQVLLDLPDIDLYGIRPVFGGLPAGAGLSAGLNYQPRFLDGANRHAYAQALYSLNGYYGGDAIYGVEGDDYVHYAYARYHHKPQEDFYGTGPDSREDAEAIYGLDEVLVGGLFGRSLGNNLTLGTHASVRADRFVQGTAEGGMPHVSDRFPEAAGVGRDVTYVMIGSFVEYDSRDVPGDRAYGQRFAPTEDRLRRLSLDATSGLYLSSQITHHLDAGYDRFSFTRFSIDLQEYFSIDEGTHHGVALRQFASFTHTSGDQKVPFYRLQSVGGSESLRGYTTGRFRDYNVLLTNAEVRCQVWHWLDMAVFGDAGHVFRRFDDLGADTIRGNVGVGFRLRTDEGTAARLEFARGTEGTRMTLELGSLL